MKTIVIYKSKTGFVRKYAEWIAEDLGADIFEVSKVNLNILKKYDTLIYGGSLHAVGIIGVKFITKNFDKLMDKRLVVFATGASPASEGVRKEVITNNLLQTNKSILSFSTCGRFRLF